jgi:hypothetical protein
MATNLANSRFSCPIGAAKHQFSELAYFKKKLHELNRIIYNDTMKRREFLRGAAAAGAAMGFGFEEKALQAQLAGSQATSSQTNPPSASRPEELPTGKIGDLAISRLICGGNLISGFAHSRDLIYVSDLLRNYFTDDKIMDTLQISESQGINTAILRFDDKVMRLLSKYRRERAGKIQWIAQVDADKAEFSGIQLARENGAVAAFIHGGDCDELVGGKKLDVLAKAVEAIRDNGLPAGVGGHKIDVPIACENSKIPVDFYMKTLNAKNYWSAGPMPRHDSVWEETPEKTIEFMRAVAKPWIAYKVLGAGAIHPEEGFQYAYDNGADFLCVGMFDFQIAEDARIARKTLAGPTSRTRRWF